MGASMADTLEHLGFCLVRIYPRLGPNDQKETIETLKFFLKYCEEKQTKA